MLNFLMMYECRCVMIASACVEFLTEEYAYCVAGVVASLLERLRRFVVMALDATFFLRARC